MTSPASTPPEAAGPGSYDPSGLVTYGDATAPGARVHIDPPVPPEQREADRAGWEARSRCTRCSELPDDLVSALRKALADAKAGKIT